MIELRAGGAHCSISPNDGGRIAALSVDGLQLLVRREDVTGHDTNAMDPDTMHPDTTHPDTMHPDTMHPDSRQPNAVDPMSWGCYPMAPFAGRVRNGRFVFDGNEYQLRVNLAPHAIHGTVFTQPWSVNDAGDTFVALTCPLGDHWPFGGVAHQRIELAADRLVCQLGVTADELAMPAQVGWHPWFTKPSRAQLSFARMYRRDEAGIPTGTTIAASPGPWDDCFVEPLAPLELRYDRSGVATPTVVAISSDCDHWVVYDQPQHATCVEPQSGPPDGFNATADAFTLLEPHDTLVRQMTISWR